MTGPDPRWQAILGLARRLYGYLGDGDLPFGAAVAVCGADGQHVTHAVYEGSGDVYTSVYTGDGEPVQVPGRVP